MKKCTKCKTEKQDSEFGKYAKMKSGLRSSCKDCYNSASNFYRRTKQGLVSRIYGNQKKRSINRGHLAPTYSLSEIRAWLLSQPKFHALYDNWEKSGFVRKLAPSIDRIDDSIGYTMSNIQLMTWAENDAKGHADLRSGKLKNSASPHKSAKQYNLEGELINEFLSVSEAARQTGIRQGDVSRCCNGKRQTAGGFRWAFKEKGTK